LADRAGFVSLRISETRHESEGFSPWIQTMSPFSDAFG